MNALSINVAGLLKETAGAAREYPIDAPPGELTHLLEGESEAHGVKPLVGSVRLMRTERSIFARGRLTAELAVDCSRCLAEARIPVRFDVEAEYFPEVDIYTGRGLPKPDDDLAFTVNASHELDLSEAVRQHLILELPMRAVCKATCAGLCPRCGANLNEGPCGCPAEVEDNRLAPLRALLEQVKTE